VRYPAIALLISLAGCTAIRAGLRAHAIIGFSVDTPQRTATLRRRLLGARRLGVVGPGQRPRAAAEIHALIAQKTPGLAAICGFGAGVARPGKVAWDPGTAANYSNGGCDVVGWYNYSPFGRRHPNNGKGLDWTMKALLPAMAHSLARKGWNIARTPLYGIGQAWGGSYDKRYYQPGLTSGEMLKQATAFCEFGARYVGWYAWDDSGYDARTETPNNSKAVADGIAQGINACTSVWKP